MSSTLLQARSHIMTFEMFIASLGHFTLSWIIYYHILVSLAVFKSDLQLRRSSSQSYEVFSPPALFRLIIAQMCPFNFTYKFNTFLSSSDCRFAVAAQLYLNCPLFTQLFCTQNIKTELLFSCHNTVLIVRLGLGTENTWLGFKKTSWFGLKYMLGHHNHNGEYFSREQ